MWPDFVSIGQNRNINQLYLIEGYMQKFEHLDSPIKRRMVNYQGKAVSRGKSNLERGKLCTSNIFGM